MIRSDVRCRYFAATNLSPLHQYLPTTTMPIFYGNSLLAQTDSGGLSYFHNDHLVSTRLLTDSNGNAISNSDFNYSPYGELLNGTGSLTNYHFTGQYRDADLSLQYHRARWLNPSLATWLSTDPVFDFPENFGNGYSYAGLNPICNQDFSGLFSIGEFNVTAAIQSIIRGIYSATRLAKSVSLYFKAKFYALCLSAYATVSNFIIWAQTGSRSGWYGFVTWLQRAGTGIRNIPSGIQQIVSFIVSRFSNLFQRVPSIQDAIRRGFTSRNDLREAWRQLGFTVNRNFPVHHFVEQYQAGVRFATEAIHSRANSIVISLQNHRLITAFYNSSPRTLGLLRKFPDVFSGFTRFRDFMRPKSWEVQWRWGFAIVRHVVEHKTLQNFDPRHYGLL